MCAFDHWKSATSLVDFHVWKMIEGKLLDINPFPFGFKPFSMPSIYCVNVVIFWILNFFPSGRLWWVWRGLTQKLFAFLMQYVHDISTGPNLSLLNELAPIAFDLAQTVPSSHAASTLLDVLLEKREEFTGKGKKRPVSIATVSFIFKLLRFASHVTT